MPTEQEIKQGVRDSAKLEVAKKLKVLIKQNLAKIREIDRNFKEPNSKQLLAMADEAIGHNRQISLSMSDGKNMPITLEELASSMDEDEKKKFVEQFGGLPNELVPTLDELDEVGNIAARSVKKATGPITVMGTSLFTLITSFFEAIGDLFSGKIGFGDFFGRVKEIAAERTGEAAGGNLREGLNQLREQSIANGKPMKWLTPGAIESAVDGVKEKALVAAGVKPEGPKDKDVLDKLDTGQVYTRVVSEKAQADIMSSVQTQLSKVVTATVGAEPSGSFIDTARAMAGFKASPQDAKKITDTVANAVAMTVANPNYKYDGNDPVLLDKLKDGKPLSTLTQPELSKLLQEETQKALVTANNKSGFFSFKMSDDHIKAIVGQMDGYVKTNYTMLGDANKAARSSPNAPAPAPVIADKPVVSADVSTKLQAAIDGSFDTKMAYTDPDTKAAVASTMRDQFVAKLNQFGAKQKPPVKIEANDPYVERAKAKFAEMATQVIAANPRLMEAGQEKDLSKAILTKMLDDSKFLEESRAMLKKVGAPVAEYPTPTLVTALSTGFTELFKKPEMRKLIVGDGIITQAMIDADKKAQSGAAAPSTGAAAPDVPVGPSGPAGPAGGPAGPAGGPTGSPPPSSNDVSSPDNILYAAYEQTQKGLLAQFGDQTGSTPTQPVLTPEGKIFEAMTGLKGDKKKDKLKELATAIIGSGVITPDATGSGVFTFDGATLALKDPNMDPVAAFEAAKKQIADRLNKGLAPDSKEAQMNNALAEGVALQMVDQTLPPDKKLLDDKGKVKDPAKADQFTKAQTAVAQKFIADKIETGLNDPTTRGMASLTMGVQKDRLKLIADKAAEGIAPLVVKGAKPPTEEEIRKAVDDKLKDVVPDAGTRQSLADGMAKAFTDEMSGKPVDEAAKAQKARENMALAKVMAKKQAHDGIESFKDWAKDLAAHGRLAPEKIPTRFGKWLGRHAKPLADDFMDVTDHVVSPEKRAAKVDQWTAANVRQDVLEKTIADAIVDCADPKWQYGTEKKSFADLSEDEKKNVVRGAVKDAVRRDFDQIFPNQPNIGGMSIPIPPGIKDKISNEVGNGTGDSMKFAAAPTTMPNLSFASLSSLPSQSFTTGKPLAQSGGVVMG